MTDDKEVNIYEEIGKEISEGLNVSGKSVDERYLHLSRAEEMIFNQPGTSALDNFLTEVLQFITDKDAKICTFVISFIERACKKDPEVMKKAIGSLAWAISDPSSPGVVVQKKVINACTQLYPYILKWAAHKKADKEVEETWTLFCQLKQRIMETLDSENEGIRTMALKFLEAVILCQTPKSEFSTPTTRSQCQMSLEEVSRDHTYISYRMLASEATFNFNRLLEEMTSSHISSLNLVTVISSICNVSRQRPEHFPQVLSALESLHVNLPPTLGTSQVKSVRKELKMHLLRMLKHPACFTHHHQINQLLVELGASQSEIAKAMPAPSEVSEALKRRVAAARLDSMGQGGQKRTATVEEASGDVDLREIKRLKLDEEEYDDSVVDLFKQLDDPESATHATQRAIDMTTDYVLQRLSITVVTKLVIISLYTLPDQMPPAFASSYTPIDGAGSDAQKRHLARMLAIQLTRSGEGPGIEYIKAEKQRMFLARQAARSDGAVIPPTPMAGGADAKATPPSSSSTSEKFLQPQMPAMRPKMKPQSFNLFTITRQLPLKEAQEMMVSAYKRIMHNEKRAIQGGAGLAQQKVLVRLATRYHSIVTNEIDATLLNFIVEDQRTDLALLWLAELYAQLKGFSVCVVRDVPNGQFTDIERYVRYDTVLCNLLSTLYDRGEHKETLFHRIFLEIPLITPASMSILKLACVDKVYGAFAITTLRELILTRPRQRTELLRLLLEFSYFERNDVKEHCVKTAKELCEIDYVRGDVRSLVIEMSELLVQPTAPKVIWRRTGRFDRKTEEAMKEMPWDESLIRAALHLFLALLPSDPSLLPQLASVCAKASTEIKRVTFRSIEQAIKSIGMHSEDLLQMIENCPEGAETLVARVVHLLTERNPPTGELVEKVRRLHKSRNTDVRSLIPILNGLEKKELLALIPKFVLSATNGKSVPAFFKKLLFGRHINNREMLLTPVELLIELHKVRPANFKEQQHLVLNLDLILIDKGKEYNIPKDAFANAIESLLGDGNSGPPPPLLFHTLQRMHEDSPALSSFIGNVLIRIAQRKVWVANSDLWPMFVKCVKVMGKITYMAIITQLEPDEFKQCLQDVGSNDLAKRLKVFIALLSAQQQNSIPKAILEMINEEAK